MRFLSHQRSRRVCTEISATDHHLHQQEALVTQLRRCGRSLCSLLLVGALLSAPCLGRPVGQYSNAADWSSFRSAGRAIVIIGAVGLGAVILMAVLVRLSRSHSKTMGISVDPPNLDFGKVTIGNATTREIKLVNRGVSPLHVDPPSISSKCFSVVKPWVGPLVLAGREQTTILVAFNPGSNAKCSGLLESTVVDPAKTGARTITIRLAGKTKNMR